MDASKAGLILLTLRVAVLQPTVVKAQVSQGALTGSRAVLLGRILRSVRDQRLVPMKVN